MRSKISAIVALSLLTGCAALPGAGSADDPASAHALAVRKALGQGEAPPVLPVEARPAAYYRRLSWISLGLGIASAAAGAGVAQDPRGPGPHGDAVTALFGLSGAFMGAGLSFAWFAHGLDSGRP